MIKNVYLTELNEKDCCGCTACANACPVDAIEMATLNKAGFWYPKLKYDKCIHCGKCAKVCPMNIMQAQCNKDGKIYTFLSGDTANWLRSASGGAFYDICKVLSDNHPIYYGAIWDGLKVRIDSAESLQEIKKFQKSKYVEAQIGDNVFKQIKKQLDIGHFVVFSGTPCMIAGLKLYLGKEYDNLITIDFVCHGKGAPGVFDAWISSLNNRFGKKVTEFSFREKKFIGDHVNSNCCSYTFEDGRKKIVTRDPYHHTYVNGLIMRCSCIDCRFAIKRYSDLTLADLKNQSVVLKRPNKQRTYSTIMVNSINGEKIIEKIKKTECEITEIPREIIEKYNPKICKVLAGNPKRNEFMELFEKSEGDIYKLIKKYSGVYPSEWGEYNLSNKSYKILSRPLRFMDAVVRLLRKSKYQ